MPDVERLRDEVERVMEASLQGVWAEYPRYCESARDAIVDLIEKRGVERVTTTERHAELHGALMVAIQRGLAGVEGGEDDPPLVRAAEVVLPIIEHERAAERVRVVEGLVATIKALPALEKGTSIGTNYYADADFVRLDDVLAVVEAAGRGVGDG